MFKYLKYAKLIVNNGKKKKNENEKRFSSENCDTKQSV